jgi:hypothetical protein
MSELRVRVRAIILGFTGVLVALVVVRFFLVLLGANAGQPIVGLFLSLTSPLVMPFVEFNSLIIAPAIEVASIVALMVMIVLGLLVSEIATAFMYDDVTDILLNITDAIFKILESLLILRLVLRLLGVAASTGWFVSNIYSATNWASGVFPAIPVFTGALELSTLAVLIIVAVVDFATEGMISSLRDKSVAKSASPKPVAAPSTTTTVTQVRPSAPPMQQHITINVPAPQQQQPRVERQIINVQPPRAVPAANLAPRSSRESHVDPGKQ